LAALFPGIRWDAMLLLAGICTFGMARLSWRFIEQPALRLKNARLHHGAVVL
jgi:peptidoglycan/LPS O-acetylase OafA/YrhL